MGKHIKTYGEIQYYLYDGDKKEKKVSKDSFMKSKDVSVKHNSPKPEQKSTKSLTGKVIESFESFSFNGSNLPIDYNKDSTGTKFDGGDGPDGSKQPDTFIPKVKKVKPLEGSNTKQEQEERNNKRKKNAKKQKNAEINKYRQTSNDIITGFNLYDPMQNTKL